MRKAFKLAKILTVDHGPFHLSGDDLTWQISDGVIQVYNRDGSGNAMAFPVEQVVCIRFLGDEPSSPSPKKSWLRRLFSGRSAEQPRRTEPEDHRVATVQP